MRAQPVLDVRSGTCRHFCPGLHTALARMSGAEPSVLVLLVAGVERVFDAYFLFLLSAHRQGMHVSSLDFVAFSNFGRQN
jgi:hypothetical protein